MTPLSDEPVRKPFILNRKEEQILQAGHDYECFTLDDIIHLLQFSKKSRNYVGALLRKLSGGRDYDSQQFLYRFPVPAATKGTKERVYCLGAKGREVLALSDVYQPTKFRYLSYSPILHDLMLSRFIIAATTYFTAQSEYTLLETRMCYQLACNPPRIEAETNGKKTTITVIPDAWLHIERVADGNDYALAIEIDLGTENRQKFQRLLKNRLTLAKSQQYEKTFNTPAVLLCYVTTGATPELRDNRLRTLLRWTEDVLPEDKSDEKKESERQQLAALFRFATVEYKSMYDQTHALFAEPVWYTPDEPEQVPLFDQ